MAATTETTPDAASLRDAVARRLQSAGQRATPTRDALVDVLAGAGRPQTVTASLGAGGELAQSAV